MAGVHYKSVDWPSLIDLFKQGMDLDRIFSEACSHLKQ